MDLKRSAGGLGFVGALLVSGVAHAHGPPPQADYVVVDGDFAVVASISFGLYVTHDGGASFEYICPDLFSSSGVIDAYNTNGLVLVPGSPRGLLVAGTGGLFRSADDGCTWAPPDGVSGRVGGIALVPGDPQQVAVVTEQGGDPIDNALLLSSDGGQTFARSGLEGPYFFKSVAIAANTFYATSHDPATGELRLHRSEDGAETWTDAVVEGAAGTLKIRHATDNVVLVSESRTTGDRLWRTEDAETFATVLTAEARLHQILPRGDELWLGTDGGAFISDDDGATWTLGDPAPGMLCLVEAGGTLYSCGRLLEDQTGVARSPDGGATWQTFLDYTAASGPAACHGPTEASVCTDDRWVVQCIEYLEWGLDADCFGEGATDTDTDTATATATDTDAAAKGNGAGAPAGRARREAAGRGC